MAATLFISYAHRDEAYRRELCDALQPLAECGLLDVWHDRRMVAGDDIFPNIAAALERARIVVLLVSEAFLGSEECAREMWRALDNRRRRGTVVVPVILRSCGWRGAPFGKLNALPLDGAPLDLAEDRTAVLAATAAGIGAVADDLVRAEATRQRRRRWLLAAVAVALLPFALRHGLPLPSGSGAVAVPTELTWPRGVFVLAEIRASAPDGKAWNPQALGVWRLPVPLLCFRQSAQAEEVCMAGSFGAAQGPATGQPNTSHVAATYAAMVGWNRRFSVRLESQRAADNATMGRGDCRFGQPCRIVADGAGDVTVAEVLVLPALDTVAVASQTYLQRCVEPGSLLAQQWRIVSSLAGLDADPRRLSYLGLAQRYAAVSEFELDSGQLDALLNGRFAGAAAAVERVPFRAELWQAAIAPAQIDAPPPLPGAAAALLQLRLHLRQRLLAGGFGEPAADDCDSTPDAAAAAPQSSPAS
ncbi:MAG: hypothetical protein BGP24_11070 [Lysobacterales bacterium 69-70]|nr:toll/interleukin-1 receptor domain-containing protein [Xanthomonadaceae bacterium]ODU30770.1 MAG: hypothetical protein ABS97_20840 [Xanthomonadaceae bacterium SCN 69-320]ODV22097.1 MAG: hypothetical protein ABT27_02215 [Xanthomonadaceae bacterium SCN 69-25]OJY98358.1 MAG: hypothetical protein BGP24_11070 [Xanthomonadales bacterium 69-70]